MKFLYKFKQGLVLRKSSIYLIRATFTFLNLFVSLLILKQIEKDVFNLMMAIGLIQYVLLSLNYFSEFATYLKIKPLSVAMNSVISKRFNFSVLPLTLIGYYFFTSIFSITQALVLIVPVFLWVFTPYELYTRCEMSLSRELKIENIRLIYNLGIRIFTLIFLSDWVLILGFVGICLFPLFFFIFTKNISLMKCTLSFKYFKSNNGLIYGLMALLYVKFDFMLSYFLEFPDNITLGHKLEELVLVGLSLFVPASQREVENLGFKKVNRIVVFLILFFLSIFISLKYIVFTSFSEIQNIFFIKEILLRPKLALAFTATAFIYFYNDLLYYKYLISGSITTLIKPFLFVLLIYIGFQIFSLIYFKEIFIISRVFSAILFFFGIKYLYKKNGLETQKL